MGEGDVVYTIEFPDKEAIEENLDNISTLNDSELLEIILEEEDIIPGFIMGIYSDEVLQTTTVRRNLWKISSI